jgi:hypothetical protein
MWLPFVLVNAGCLMRVSFQIATDFGEWAYAFAGVSGILEWTGMALWGVPLWRIMNGWKPVERTAAARPTRITAEDKIGLIVEWFPQTLPILIEKGFTPLANPVLRRTMARAVSVRMAAEHHQLDVRELLADLNRAAFGSTQTSGMALPVLNHA